MKTTLLLAATALVACTEATPSSKSTLPMAPAPSPCALGVPETSVVHNETKTGASLTFVTTPRNVGDLRWRTRDAAQAHGPAAERGLGHDGRHGNGGAHGLKPMQLPPTTTATEDVEGGAKITFVPADERDLGALRAKLAARADAMMTRCE